MQVKLINFKAWHTHPDGRPLEGSYGPYVRLSAQFDLPEYQGRWATCNVKPENPAVNWQKNNFVEIEGITTKGEYLNFTLPKKSTQAPVATGNTQLLEKIFTAIQGLRTELKTHAKEIKDLVRGLQIVESAELVRGQKLVDTLEDDVEAKDIPF